MYPISDAFKTAIKTPPFDLSFKMTITLPDSTVLTVTDDNIVQGTVSLTSSVMQDGSYAPGAAMASDFGITLISNTTLAAIDFSTTALAPSVGLRLPDGTIEWVPLGIFYPDDISKSNGFIAINAFDAMLKFDMALDKVPSFSFPSTISNLLSAICTACDVTLGTTTLTNDFTVSELSCKTCRDAIEYIAAIEGCWAIIDRTGKLILAYPSATTVESYNADNRFDFTPSQMAYGISNVICNKKCYTGSAFFKHVYMGGPDAYGITIDYSNNPLIQSSNSSSVNATIFDNACNVLSNCPVVSGYESNWQGNPALDVGDMVQQTDIEKNVYSCLVAKNVYYYRGNCEMSHDITVDNSSSSLTEQVESVSTTVKETTKTVEIISDSAPAWAGLATYSNNVYTATLSGVTALKNGTAVAFEVDAACATPSLQVNNLTAHPILQDTGDALDTHAGGIYEVRYNATNGNFIRD